MLPKWAWSGSREQFLHCGLRKFRHSKSSVYMWYPQLVRGRFVYDTWDNGSRLGCVMVECILFITHCLQLNLQLHTIDLVRTCRSFCTVAWQLARFQLTRRIARSMGDSWASCFMLVNVFYVFKVFLFSERFFKTLTKFRASSRLTTSTFKITATKFNKFINNRILSVSYTHLTLPTTPYV